MTPGVLAVTVGVLAIGSGGSSTHPSRPGQEFNGVQPALVWPLPSYSFQPFGLVTPEPSAGKTVTSILQLQNRRTGTTCTMRIVPAKPNLDPGIFSPAAGPHPDPIVRNSASPCVE
jgi:hypothetical protein